jgi:Flp pilus assembly protein TadD
LFCASSLLAQNALISSGAVSMYELTFRPAKQARRLFTKGTVLLKQQRFRVALGLFQEALNIDSQYWAAEIDLGYAYLKLAEQKEAQQAFERSLQIDPENAIGYTNLSVVALNNSDYRLAEKSARAALRLNPQLSEAKALLGLAEVGQGNWTPEAHKLLEDGQDSVPGSEKVLLKWPAANMDAPKVIVITSVVP